MDNTDAVFRGGREDRENCVSIMKAHKPQRLSSVEGCMTSLVLMHHGTLESGDMQVVTIWR